MTSGRRSMGGTGRQTSKKPRKEYGFTKIHWSGAPPCNNLIDPVSATLSRSKKVEVVKSSRKVSKSRKKARKAPPQIVYGLTWSQPYRAYSQNGNPVDYDLLATCTQRSVMVYKSYKKSTAAPAKTAMPKIMTFQHRQPEEELYCCEFVGHGSTARLLCAAGAMGQIWVFNLVTQQLEKTLPGHGGDVYDLKVHPVNGNLLLSAAKDRNCFLWDITAGSAVASFGGTYGHLEAVNSVSWHHSGEYFCSGGSDECIKVWKITQTVKEAIRASEQLSSEQHNMELDKSSAQDFVRGSSEHFPIYSTPNVHSQWVDCVWFIGDHIVSKSCNGDISMWIPEIQDRFTVNGVPSEPPSSEPKAMILNTVRLPHNDYYFTKFAVDPSGRIIAAGNQHGTVALWTTSSAATNPVSTFEVGCSHVIRNLAFSPDGQRLVVSTDNSGLFRLDVTRVLPGENTADNNATEDPCRGCWTVRCLPNYCLL